MPLHVSPLLALVDCNNFFVSCERLFRPDLAGKPVLVLSSNDGCVISRSAEVKEMGIPMGIPYFEIKEVIQKKGITLFSSNFTLYRDISERVMTVLAEMVDDYEVYSIDEAFFEIPRTVDPIRFASTVRERIFRDVGIPVSIGVAPTKTLAKLAGETAKRQSAGVALVMPGENIRDVSVAELWGVGRATAEKLARERIRTVGDVVERGKGALGKVLGVNGERLFFEVSGIRATASSSESGTHLTSSRSFGKATKDIRVVEDAITHHASHLAEKLRARNVVAEHGSVYLLWNEEGTRQSLSIPVMFSEATSDTRSILRALLRPVRSMHQPHRNYKKAGVTLGGISAQGIFTERLFGERSGVKESPRLMEALDRINARHGRGAVRLGTEKKTSPWESSRKFISQAYTTSWDELPRARNDL